MNALRTAIAECMVRRHRIPRELASYHAAEMEDGEIEFRVRMYAGAELSVVGQQTERINVSSTRFSRPATMTAGPRHSTLFPSSRPSKRKPGTVMPDSEVKNLVRNLGRA
jgi:hypothetical protein